MSAKTGPGRVRRRLAKMIVDRMREIGRTIEVEPDDLIPNQGYWRIDYRADVMPWTGSGKLHTECRTGSFTCSIESWATMSELIKGFDVEMTSGSTVELLAHHEGERALTIPRSRS